MIKLLKQLNQSPANQNSSESTVAEPTIKPGVVDYAKLEEAFGDNSTPEVKTEVAKTTITPEKTTEVTPIETNTVAKDEKVIESTKTPEQLEADKKATELTAATTEPVLRLADDVKLGEDKYDFISLGKESGFEVKEDNLKAFKEAQNEFVEAQKKESWSGNLLKELEKEPAEVQEAYLLAKSGQSVKAIETTLQNFDYHLSLSNFDLAKAELESNDLAPEVVEAQLEKLTEEGRIDVFAQKIREDINKGKETTIKQRTDFFTNLKAKEQNRVVEEKKQLISSLEKEAKGITDFNGLKFHETVPTGIVRNFEQGKYNLKDPKFLIKAFMAYELSEAAIKETRQKTQAEVLKTHMQSLTNTPTVDTTKNVIVNTNENQHYHNSIEEAFGKK